MKIENSTISMTSNHSIEKQYTKVESLEVLSTSNNDLAAQLKDNVNEDNIYLSDVARSKENAISLVEVGSKGFFELNIPEVDKLKLLTIKQVFKVLMGRDISINVSNVKNEYADGINNQNYLTYNKDLRMGNGIGNQRLGNFGISYNSSQKYSEKEELKFNSNGVIKTKDGKEIKFDLNINMSREFAASQNITFKAGAVLKDPLVINYDAASANIENKTFSFDIDNDGKEDQISQLGSGSGFLALDINKDGKINDGSELFGTKTGDGIEELANYDEDKNGWIDESDSVYNKLRIWSKDKNGQDKIFSLGENGIGAIYLGGVSSEYSYKDSSNSMLAQNKKTAIYVKESGDVGTVQQIDFKI